MEKDEEIWCRCKHGLLSQKGNKSKKNIMLYDCLWCGYCTFSSYFISSFVRSLLSAQQQWFFKQRRHSRKETHTLSYNRLQFSAATRPQKMFVDGTDMMLMMMTDVCRWSSSTTIERHKLFAFYLFFVCFIFFLFLCFRKPNINIIEHREK